MRVEFIANKRATEAEILANTDKLKAGEFITASDTKNLFFAVKDGNHPTFDRNTDLKKITDAGQMLAVQQTLAQLQQNMSAMDVDISALSVKLSDAQKAIDQKFGYAEVGEVDKCLYIFDKIGGKLLAGPLGPFAGSGEGGGGGGGGGTVTQMEINNTSGWSTKSISQDSDCVITFSWSSTKDDLPTGDGTLQVYVNGAQKGAPRGVAQGNGSLNLKPFIGAGTNSVRVQITDVYGTIRYLVYTVTVESVYLTSNFDGTTPYTAAFNFPYTAYGSMTKVVHFKVDNTELSTETVELSGRQMVKQIPTQTHGTHSLECWFVADVDGIDVESNHLYFEFIYIAGSTDPVISVTGIPDTVTEYDTIALKYQVYDPLNAMATVELSANGGAITTLTVDRTEQMWSYRAMDVGETILAISCRGTVKQITLDVQESSVHITPVTEGLSLYLGANGRNNGEAHPEIWEYEDISATLSNFNWRSDGWQLDEDNNTVLRVAGDARVVIPYQIFAEDFRRTGKTIEVEFATRRVRNYDTPIITCYSGNRGMQITAQECDLKSSQSAVSMQYKENEHVRVAFVVTPRIEGRMIYIYINGVCSQAIQYPDNDDFQQMNPVGISIGSNDCATDIYCIRVYDVALTRQQAMENWIADTQNADVMLARFDHNNVFDLYGNVVINKLPQNLPYLVLQTQGTHLPQFKGDKVTLSGYYVDNMDASKSFTFTGAQVDVQGTSSQYYKRKNYKIKYKGGFVIGGQLQGTYAMSDDSIPTNTFTYKADVASSEGANNTVGVDLYNDTNPYKTEAQEHDSRVRQGIEGYPIVLFEDDGNEIVFLGKANMNNDKGTPEVFGLGNDESIEFKNNTSERVLFKSDDFSDDSYLDDFEWSNPEDLNDPAQLSEFSSWVVSCDPDEATGDALPESVTYGGVEYTTDTATYRIAKFKAEAPQYLYLNQALFYYLYTELMLMVDSRAKNMFLTFWGSEVH